MRALFIGIGIAAMLLAAMIQLRADGSLNANQTRPMALQPTPPSTQIPSITAIGSSSQLFYSRPQGARGELAAYDMATARPRFKLAPGLPSADWHHYYVATDYIDGTVVEAYDLRNGSLEHRFTLTGSWRLESVSAAGSWLALSRIAGNAEMRDWLEAHEWQSEIEIVDAKDGSVAHSLRLDGNFEVDAVSDDSLFLIQHIPAVDSQRYSIRLYDLATGELLPDSLREKGEPEEMVGVAYNHVASPDGRWLLTLYLDTARKTAFIHTLDLENKNAHCVDLPSGDDELAALKAYSLALSPDGEKVYAVNAALGVIVEVSLDTRSVTRTVQFTPHVDPAAVTSTSDSPLEASVVSKDGQRLFFADRNEIWAFDTRTGKVTDNYQLGPEIYALGVNESGNRLYAATPTDSVRVFIVPPNGTLVPLELTSGQ